MYSAFLIFWGVWHFWEVATSPPTSLWSWKTSFFLRFSIFWKSPYFAQNQFTLFVWVFVQIECLQAYFKAFNSYVLYLGKKNQFLQTLVPFKGAWKIFFENSIFLFSGFKSFKLSPKIDISGTKGIFKTSENCFCI